MIILLIVVGVAAAVSIVSSSMPSENLTDPVDVSNNNNNNPSDPPAAVDPPRESDGDVTTTTNTDDLVIGAILPLTGDLSTRGEEATIAADLAVSDFNEYLKNSGSSQKLKIIIEDTITSPTIALEKTTALNAKGIDVIVGPQSSAELRLIKGYVDSNGLVVISPSSTSPSLAIPGDNVFRLIPDDTKQGPAIAEIMTHQEIKVMVPVWRGDTWGDGLRDSSASSFESRGGIVAEGIRYYPESTEYSTSASLLAENVQEYVDQYGKDNVAVLFLGFAEVLQFFQSSAEHDVLREIRWFGGDANTKEAKIILDPIALDFAHQTSFTTTQVSFNENPIYHSLSDRVMEEIGRAPNSYAFSTYDAVYLSGLSALEAQNTGMMIKDILPVLAENYSGAIGGTKLNDAGDLDSVNYDVWGIRDSQWTILGTYDHSSNVVTFIDTDLP